MGFLNDAAKKAQDAAGDMRDKIDLGEMANKANDVADDVLQKAEDLTDKIPGDFDDKLVDKAVELKDKLDGQN